MYIRSPLYNIGTYLELYNSMRKCYGLTELAGLAPRLSTARYATSFPPPSPLPSALTLAKCVQFSYKTNKSVAYFGVRP